MSAGIFTRANQAHPGCIPAEFTEIRVPIPRDGHAGGHRKPLPRWLHWLPEVIEEAVSREGVDMYAIGRGVGQGGVPEPANILRWPEKVSPAELVFFPESHPAHQGGIPTNGGGLEEILPHGYFKGATVEVRSLGITCLPVNQARLVIPNPTLSTW